LPLKEWNHQSDYVLREIIRKYFKRLSILITQIPFEVRKLLLPAYMLYNGFKSYIYFDRSGRLGFEVYREKASRFSIKPRKTKRRVEQEIFGVLGSKNMFRLNGHDNSLRGLVLTCKDFVEKYGNELPKGAGSLSFSKCLHAGPIEIGREAEVKIVNCSIYWVIGKRRYVNHIPFAWLFGNASYLNKVDPVLHSDSDFYSSLFGRLYEIITRGYEEPVDKNTQLRVLKIYTNLIEEVENEVKNSITITRADEYDFQRLLIKHKFFLHPGAMIIENQPMLRGKVLRRPDFHVQVSENEHVYLEIEPPFCKPFNGSKPSRRLKEALKQVSDWKEILVQQVEEGDTIRYMIIIGFLDDLNNEEKRTLQTFNKTQEGLVVATWDWILENIEAIKRRMMSRLA
jgi:hypothetical protein